MADTEATLWISGGGLVLSVLSVIIGAVVSHERNGNKTKKELDDKIASVIEERNKVSTALKDEFYRELRSLSTIVQDKNSETQDRVGESLQAIRQKIQDIEMFNRDNFVSQKFFDQILSEQKKNFERFEEKLDAKIDRIEGKIDIIQRNGHSVKSVGGQG